MEWGAVYRSPRDTFSRSLRFATPAVPIPARARPSTPAASAHSPRPRRRPARPGPGPGPVSVRVGQPPPDLRGPRGAILPKKRDFSEKVRNSPNFVNFSENSIFHQKVLFSALGTPKVPPEPYQYVGISGPARKVRNLAKFQLFR